MATYANILKTQAPSNEPLKLVKIIFNKNNIRYTIASKKMIDAFNKYKTDNITREETSCICSSGKCKTQNHYVVHSNNDNDILVNSPAGKPEYNRHFTQFDDDSMQPISQCYREDDLKKLSYDIIGSFEYKYFTYRYKFCDEGNELI